MKHFIKMAFYLLSIISIFGISSCEKELYENQLSEGKERITINTLDDLPFLKNSINSKISNKSTTNKEIDYFQLIDESKIVVIEDENNLKTYTLPLKLEMTDELINLIAKETNEGLKYYLINYKSTNFEEWIFNLKNNIKDNIVTEQTITEFENASRCFGSVQFWNCPSGNHSTRDIATMFCCIFSVDVWIPTYSAVEVPCGDNTADGSSGSTAPGTSPTPSSTNNNTGSGGSGTNGTPVILTSPTPCNICPVVEENIPCESLITKSNETVFRQKFKDLNSSSRFSANGETAYLESKDNNNNPSYAFKSSYTGTHQVTINNNTFSFMHVHNDENEVDQDDGSVYIGKTIKMLSPADINVFISTCQVAANSAGVANTDTYGMMISREGIFAVKMLANDDFFPAIENINIMNAKYTKKAEKIYEENPSGSLNDKQSRKEKLQKLLLSLIKEYGLENRVGIYEGEVTTPEPGQPNLPVINWTRKTLNNNGDLVENPC